METGVIVGLAVVIPIILLPAALVWYLNISGIQAVLADARNRRTVAEGTRATTVEVK
jgi:hypothetical protein